MTLFWASALMHLEQPLEWGLAWPALPALPAVPVMHWQLLAELAQPAVLLRQLPALPA